MKTYTIDDLSAAIDDVGLAAGDTVLVHSGLLAFGMMKNVSPMDVCPTIYRLILDKLSPAGTLVVPAYFYEYARKHMPYDTKWSPVSKEIGVFSQYVVNQPGVLRSYNPITALAGIGRNAEFICRSGTATSYGAESAWDRLTQTGGKMLFLGTTITWAMSYVHYIEQRFGVPHMYSKLFDTPITNDGEKIELPVISHVRYLKYDIEPDHAPFEKVLTDEGKVKSARVGMGMVYSTTCADCLETGLRLLKENVNFFLARTPDYEPGEIPTDTMAADMFNE